MCGLLIIIKFSRPIMNYLQTNSTYNGINVYNKMKIRA